MPIVLNLPLAHTVLRTLSAKPHLHDHRVWADARPEGTAHSVAGWTVTLAGAEWTQCHEIVIYRGKRRSVPMLAQELLGLSYNQARTLFFHCDEQQAINMLCGLVGHAYQQQFHQLIAAAEQFNRAS
ncbi:hypothetical protein [Nocardia sp. NPDC049149]|uniref:hypothetical protein n=1 Tax=Nocardia sp. NPDC049149 TaxID=3364315 RepID=UPI003724BBD3